MSVRGRIRPGAYKDLVSRGGRLFGRFAVAYHSKHPFPACKTAVKKKLGDAVWRNRQKRRMRAILASFEFREPLLVLVILTKPPPEDFRELAEHLERLVAPLLRARV